MLFNKKYRNHPKVMVQSEYSKQLNIILGLPDKAFMFSNISL